jgi:hypothetical protein
LTRAGVVTEIVRLPVAVKIGGGYQHPSHRAESAQKRSRSLHQYLSMRIPTIWCHMRCWKSNAVVTSTDCLSARSKRTPLSGQTFCPGPPVFETTVQLMTIRESCNLHGAPYE